MKKAGCLMMIGAVTLALAGCATTEKERIATLERRLTQTRLRTAALDKENRALEAELDLFRKARNLARNQLLAARDAFIRTFSAAMAEPSVWVSVTPRGLDVIISAEKLFVSGSDALSPEGKVFLERVAALIDATFPDHYVYIEGHTDNQPLAIFEWRSDWEFSFARALSVLKYFTEVMKMDPLRFSAAGFGQYRPRATNDTKEGRSKNRRIELVISPQRTRMPDGPPAPPASDE